MMIRIGAWMQDEEEEEDEEKECGICYAEILEMVYSCSVCTEDSLCASCVGHCAICREIACSSHFCSVKLEDSDRIMCRVCGE